MVRMWGHAIPDTNTDKGWRACYRASKSKCLMWDMSYLKLVEVVGDKTLVMETMNKLTDSRTCSVFTDGPGERVAVVYRPRMYPGGVVGEVRYMWRPHVGDANHHLLWVWLHPALYEEFVKILTEVCDLKPVESCGEPEVKKIKLDDAVTEEKNIVLSKLEPKLSPPSVLTCPGLTVTLLENNLNRFRLVGLLSPAVLRHSLEPAKVDGGSDNEQHWWADYYKDQGKKEGVENSCKVWREWNTAATVGAGRVVGIIARDPRVILPRKRNSTELTICKSAKAAPDISEDEKWKLQESPLWCHDTRTAVSVSRMQDSEINLARSKALVPGTPLDLGDREGRVPVLLVEQEGWGGGWDVIIPAGWGMSVWMCLVYSGARVGGWQELQHFQLEAGAGMCGSWEDAAWGKQRAAQDEEEERRKYFLLPPDKRVNHSIMGIASPFSRQWGILLADWMADRGVGIKNEPVNDWFIVRDRNVIINLGMGDEVGGGEVNMDYLNKGLLRVRVRLSGKGRLGENSVICLPRKSDLLEDDEGLCEPKQNDECAVQRNMERKLHKEKKKRQKRQWKKVKDKKVLMIAQGIAEEKEVDKSRMELIEQNLAALKSLREEENNAYEEKAEKLWEGRCNTVRNSSSRQVMGWIVTGGYSYRVGGEVGEGLVTVRGWQELLKLFEKGEERMVLTREISTLQYRKALIDLVE